MPDAQPNTTRPSIAVVGAGAIGSLIAGRLTAAGHDVTLLARGARLAHLRQRGLTIHTPQGATTLAVKATCSLPDHAFDLLITAVKAHSLPDVAPVLAAVARPGATLVPFVNGLPWWYFPETQGVSWDVLAQTFPQGQIVGAVVYARSALNGNGDLVVQEGERLVLGPTAPGTQAKDVGALLASGGLTVDVCDDIRREIWTKLALNLATNPLSVVSGATLCDMAVDPALRPVVAATLQETLDLAAKLGVGPLPGVEQLLAVCAGAGPFMTSMAQDYAKGAPLELDAIAGATFAAAERLGHTMPTARAVAALASQRARAFHVMPAAGTARGLAR